MSLFLLAISSTAKRYQWHRQEAQVRLPGSTSDTLRRHKWDLQEYAYSSEKLYIVTIQSNISRVTFDEKWGIICWMPSFSAFYIFSFIINIITLPPQNLMFFKYFAPKSYSLSRRCNCMYILKMITQLQIIAYNLKLKKWRKFYYLQSQCSLLW